MFGKKQTRHIGFNPFSKQQKESPSISQKIIDKIKYWFTDYLNPSSCIQREIIQQQTIYVPVSYKIVDAQTIEHDSIQICQNSQKSKRNKFTSFDDHLKEQEAQQDSKQYKKELKQHLKSNEMKSSFDQVLPDNIDPQEGQDAKPNKIRRKTSSHLYKKRKLNEKQKQIGIKFVHKKHVIDQIQDSINESGIQVIPEEASEDSLKNNSLLGGQLKDEPKDVVLEIIAPLVKNEPPPQQPAMLTPLEIMETNQKGLKKSQSVLNLNEHDSKSRKQSEVILKQDEQKKDKEQDAKVVKEQKENDEQKPSSQEQKSEVKVGDQKAEEQDKKQSNQDQKPPAAQDQKSTQTLDSKPITTQDQKNSSIFGVKPDLFSGCLFSGGLFSGGLSTNPPALLEKKSGNQSQLFNFDQKPENGEPVSMFKFLRKPEEKKQEQQQEKQVINVSDTPLFGNKAGDGNTSQQPRKLQVESSQFTNAFDSKDQQKTSEQNSGLILQQNLFTFTQNKPQEQQEQGKPPILDSSDSQKNPEQTSKTEASVLKNFQDSTKNNEQKVTEKDNKELDANKSEKISIFSTLITPNNQQEKKPESLLFGSLIQEKKPESQLFQNAGKLDKKDSKPESQLFSFPIQPSQPEKKSENSAILAAPKQDQQEKKSDSQIFSVFQPDKKVDNPSGGIFNVLGLTNLQSGSSSLLFQNNPIVETNNTVPKPGLFTLDGSKLFNPAEPPKPAEPKQPEVQNKPDEKQSNNLFGSGLDKKEQPQNVQPLFGTQVPLIETPKNQETKLQNDNQKQDLQTPNQLNLNCQWLSGEQKQINSNDKSMFAFLKNNNNEVKSDQIASDPAKSEATPIKQSGNPFLIQSPQIDQKQIDSYFSNNSYQSNQPQMPQTQQFGDLFKQQPDSAFNQPVQTPKYFQQQQQPSVFQYQQPQQQYTQSLFQQNINSMNSMNNEMEITDYPQQQNQNQVFMQQKPLIPQFNFQQAPPPVQNGLFNMGQSFLQQPPNDLTNQLSFQSNNSGQISQLQKGLFQDAPKLGQQSGSLNNSFTSKQGKKKQRIV